MILVDSRVGSKELVPLIKRIGIPCELAELTYGDAATEGNGPDGPGTITIGFERKTLHDMLACVEDSRYSAHQLPGMKQLYTVSFLCLEGLWEAGNNGKTGLLMQGFNHGASWGPLKTVGNRTVLYSKLFRYLLSVQLSGVIITFSNNITHTAYNIAEIQQYFQKPWKQHRSLLETQKLNIPCLSGKPSLARRWAQEIDEVGVVHGEAAAKRFKTGRALANASEEDWMRVGVGAKTARKIVRDVNGW